jgi:pimeloyl-ACP methyl ester carboxylesterase
MQNLVLIPGLLCTEALWSHQVQYLAELAHCSVADLTAGDSIDAYARSALDKAPEKFAVCGLSLGGIVAHQIMRIAPERVERLALVDTTARPETPEQTERRVVLIDKVKGGGFEGIHELLLPALVHPDRVGDAALSEAIREMARAVGPDAFLRQIHAIMARLDSRPHLSAYTAPTLLVCGREDAVTPVEFHEEMADLIPHAKLAVIEQCGHMSTMERPQAVTALLRQWLLYD